MSNSNYITVTSGLDFHALPAHSRLLSSVGHLYSPPSLFRSTPYTPSPPLRSPRCRHCVPPAVAIVSPPLPPFSSSRRHRCAPTALHTARPAVAVSLHTVRPALAVVLPAAVVAPPLRSTPRAPP
ncbi:hypothetical protein C8R44DRAFT_864348 [Mycena epipterygia]|nr:hypothetical protein C8R44DRAFT_864348 [Mycena epipterygia]